MDEPATDGSDRNSVHMDPGYMHDCRNEKDSPVYEGLSGVRSSSGFAIYCLYAVPHI